MNAIDIDNIKLKIGRSEILKGVSFSVSPEQIHALIGYNGAGKTSLLRILLGLTTAYSGKILIQGSKNLNMSRRYIGSVMDTIMPDCKCSGAAYLHNICYMLGVEDKKSETAILEKVGLLNDSKKNIEKYSLGMKKRLMIACALAGKPKLLILDEPFNGIDPKGMNEMRLLLQRLKSEKVTVLITSHIITELLKSADTFSIMHDGRIVDTISSSELSNVKYPKVILKPNDVASFVQELEQRYPDVFCVPSSNDTIAIFNMEIEKFETGIHLKNNYVIKSLEQQLMNEEDILLWKMNGFHI